MADNKRSSKQKSKVTSLSTAERHQIENEMIFRRINEKVGDDIGALDAMHIEDGNIHMIADETMVLLFKCECSDEKCDARIPLVLETYQTIHADRDTFIVKTDHQVDPIEKVIQRETGYNVVRKNNSTPEPSSALNETSINN